MVSKTSVSTYYGLLEAAGIFTACRSEVKSPVIGIGEFITAQ